MKIIKTTLLTLAAISLITLNSCEVKTTAENTKTSKEILDEINAEADSTAKANDNSTTGE